MQNQENEVHDFFMKNSKKSRTKLQKPNRPIENFLIFYKLKRRCFKESYTEDSPKMFLSLRCSENKDNFETEKEAFNSEEDDTLSDFVLDGEDELDESFDSSRSNSCCV